MEMELFYFPCNGIKQIAIVGRTDGRTEGDVFSRLMKSVRLFLLSSSWMEIVEKAS